ncbi:RNA 2',3'-cyclic phosphodiesterase [Sphingomonas sp. KR1UV-12]|uniref:RNA 2',3'-cyclic phosphodiesterase n=1 Tax=Sphingomonas aurea TaxID=3063994 RepID=A0ABT9EFU0_9SPHN|nr:RNA 2',3'-cyclic phosphodiesterase [Sphingomonas sp. KR1UV-12]MDP1025829.1 RNA 2',3'-cyclic phosphodiesterase [Sphingomonas sp. KR1UV-12]
MIRLFLALRPPPSLREMLFDVMDDVPGARWQDDEQLHVTLRFVGEVDRPQAEDLAAALGQVHAPAPMVSLAGVGSFDQRGRVDTLWAGLSPAEPLARLHASVEQACARAGLPPERRAYRPHVTVARLARSAGSSPAIAAWLVRHAALRSAPVALPHLILYRSHLGRSGASYEPVARWPLEG